MNRTTLSLLVAMICACPAFAQYPRYPTQNPRYLVHGFRRTCQELPALDRALSSTVDYYFPGWSSADFDAAVYWVNACAPTETPDALRTRVSQLRERQKQMMERAANQIMENKAAEQRREDARLEEQRLAEEANNQRIQEHAQLVARQEEFERKEKERAARMSMEEAAARKCHKTPAFALFEVQQRLNADLDRKATAQRQLDKENKIEEISGTENLSNKYRYGQIIVDADEDIETNWAKYKSLGGSAPTLATIPHATNPCTEPSSSNE
jgi:hypothetical protein